MEIFKAELLDDKAVMRVLKRISHEILEKNGGAHNLCILGIKSRGIPLAEKIAEYIDEIEHKKVPVGQVDITLYRDDLTEISRDPVVGNSLFPFDITGKDLVLVDDVLHTGRTVRAAMEAVMKFGRPKTVQLAVLIDRGHRELPIRGDYVGKNVPTSKTETVSVNIPPYDDELAVKLYDTLRS